MKYYLKAVAKRKLSEDIVDQIKNLILHQKLKPGDRLPSERELTTKFSVGRPSIREALRSLEIIGLIQVYHGKGAYVKELDFSTYLQNLRDQVTTKLLSNSVSLEEFYGGRKLIEPYIAQLVARTRTAEEIRSLRELLRKTEEAFEEGGSFIKFSALFHARLAEMTHNQLIRFSLEFMLTLSPQARLQKFAHRAFREMVLRDHQRIVDHIHQRNGERAKKEMEEHLENLIRWRKEK